MSPEAVEPPVWQHWYDVVSDDSLRQGDIFMNLTVPVLPRDLPLFTEEFPTDSAPLAIEHKNGNWIAFSASCDLDYGRSIPFVLVGNIVQKEVLYDATDSAKARNSKTEILRKGLVPSKFLLADQPDFSPPLLDAVVDFKHYLTVPTAYLRRACNRERLRMKAPFREWFGSWVGSNMSRVGLEDNQQIPKGKGSFSPERLLELVESENLNPEP